MRTSLALLVLVTLLGVLPAAWAGESPGLAWERRLSDALSRAAEEEKPILVLCHFALAPASKQLVQEVYADDALASEVAKRFVPLLLDGDAADSAESGKEALSRFSVSFFPTHLVLDTDGQILATVEGTPGTTPSRVSVWLQRLAQDLLAYKSEAVAVRERPDDADARIALLQTRLDLASRSEDRQGGWVVHQPPAAAHHRQIDAVIAEAETVAKALEATSRLHAGRAWTVWAGACLVGGRDREQALARMDRLLDALPEPSAEAAYAAFNTAYALYERDPEAALPYLRRAIAQGPENGPYWHARAYEAYAEGRLGRWDKAKSLYRRIVADGPETEPWVRWAKGQLERVEQWERKQAEEKSGR